LSSETDRQKIYDVLNDVQEVIDILKSTDNGIIQGVSSVGALSGEITQVTYKIEWLNSKQS